MKENMERTMQLLHKFPEPLQYEIKGNYFKFVEKNPEKTIKLYELWSKLQPHNIKAHKELAETYIDMRDADKALEQLLIVASMTPSDFTVLSDIVEAYIRKNNFEDAKKILKDFAEKYPDNYKSYFKLGQLYESMGEFKKAKEQHEIASLIEPNINDITLAKIETKFGEFDLAVNKLNELYESPNRTNEGKYNILRALSDIYYKIGKVEKSIDSSEEAYKLEPTWPITGINDAVALARVYIQMGDNKSADSVSDKVKQIIPAEDESRMGSLINLLKGELFLERNDYEKVEEIILETEKLIQEVGLNMLVARKERILAELHEKKGDWENAL